MRRLGLGGVRRCCRVIDPFFPSYPASVLRVHNSIMCAPRVGNAPQERRVTLCPVGTHASGSPGKQHRTLPHSPRFHTTMSDAPTSPKLDAASQVGTTVAYPLTCHVDSRHARSTEGARTVPRNGTCAGSSPKPNPQPHQRMLGQVRLPTLSSRSVWIPIISVFALSRCVGSISSGFSGKEQGCLENCVGRFFDASDYLIRRVELQRAMAGAQ